MTDKIKPLQQASEAQPEPADFDTWLKEQFEYKNWYYREGGSGGMAVPFARKAWNAGFAKGEDSQAGQCWKCGDADPDFQGKCEAQPAEPVAWMRPSENGYDDSAFRDHSTVVACTGNPWTGWIPLYTAPQPQRQPLTEQQINSMWVDVVNRSDPTAASAHFLFVRAIEAALGITKGKS